MAFAKMQSCKLAFPFLLCVFPSSVGGVKQVRQGYPGLGLAGSAWLGAPLAGRLCTEADVLRLGRVDGADVGRFGGGRRPQHSCKQARSQRRGFVRSRFST